MGGNNRQQMGPLYRMKRIQDTIHQNSSFVICSDQNESIPLPVSQRRDRKSSQQTGSGKGTESGSSRLLFLDIPCAKKERKVSFNIRPVFIKPLHRETVKSVRQAMRLNDSAVSIDLTDAYLHVPIHHQSRKYLRFVHEDQVYHFSALPFGMSLSPLIFSKLMDVIAAFLRQRAISVFPYLDDWLIKKSDSQPSDYSDKDLHSNYSKPRFFAKSQEVRSLSCSEIHLHRYGISDATKFSQGSSGSCTEPNSNNQETNVSKTCIGTNLLSLLGKLSAAADLVLLGRLHLRPLQMCLLSVWKPHILPLDHPISINGMIQSYLQWWINPI